jgi:carotenoid cleavage dioxygenase
MRTEEAPISQINPFLAHNFAPVADELDTGPLEIQGALPSGLRGTFLRNGPNPQFVADPARYHWFDGDGMLHAVRLGDGQASYANRYVRTRGFELERAAGRALWRGFRSGPEFDNPGGPFKNVANTNLLWFGGELLCLWEGGKPHAVRLPGLETLGLRDFGGRLRHPFTAHPKVDPDTGELFTFGYVPAPPPFCSYSHIDATGRVLHSQAVELPRPVMMHDFAITRNFAVFLDFPLVFGMDRNGPSLAFRPELGARIGLLPRAGGAARWFEVLPGYAFHVINAYEQDGTVVVLACRAQRSDLLGSESVADAARGRPYRWRIDLESGRVTEELLHHVACDFPRIHDGYTGRVNRFAYVAPFAPDRLDAPHFTGLAKLDLDEGTLQLHRFGEGRFGGEGVFVPRPGGTAEDDGWVLSYVYDEGSGISELWVLDAGDFAAAPLARVRLPRRVPYGFHALWVPA